MRMSSFGCQTARPLNRKRELHQFVQVYMLQTADSSYHVKLANRHRGTKVQSLIILTNTEQPVLGKRG
jgi:hypothetical protein